MRKPDAVLTRQWERKKATPKVMRLVDSHSGQMQCKVCGSIHYANIKPESGGNFYRGSWQCQRGCRL